MERLMKTQATLGLALALALTACGGPTTPVPTGTTSAALSCYPKGGTYTLSETTHYEQPDCAVPPWSYPLADLYLNLPTTFSVSTVHNQTDLNNLSDLLQASVVAGNEACNPPGHLDPSSCVVDDGIVCEVYPHGAQWDNYTSTMTFNTNTSFSVNFNDQGQNPKSTNLCLRSTTVTYTRTGP